MSCSVLSFNHHLCGSEGVSICILFTFHVIPITVGFCHENYYPQKYEKSHLVLIHTTSLQPASVLFSFTTYLPSCAHVHLLSSSAHSIFRSFSVSFLLLHETFMKVGIVYKKIFFSLLVGRPNMKIVPLINGDKLKNSKLR